MFNKYSIKENVIVWIIIAVFIFLTSFPYIIGFLISGNEYFIGNNIVNLPDVNVYLSYIEQVKAGKILLANLFTSEAHVNVFFSPLWLATGLIAKILNLDSVLIFHLTRIIAAILFAVFIFYYFLDLFFTKFFEKIISFILICFSSGLGIFFLPNIVDLIYNAHFPMFILPVDFLLAEANTFLSAAHSSLFIFSQLLIVISFYIFLKNDFRARNFIYILFITLFLGFSHPYDVLVVLGVLLVYFLISLIFKNFKLIKNYKVFIGQYLLVILGFFITSLYYYFIVRKEIALWGWFDQNITLSPTLLSYLISYSPLIVLIPISLYLNIRKDYKNFNFLLIWVITLFFLAYLPFQFQSRLFATCHIGLAILASYAIISFIKFLLKVPILRPIKISVIAMLFLFLTITNFAFIFMVIFAYNTIDVYSYFPNSYYQAALWLKHNSQPEEVILAGGLNGNFLPAIAVRPVYLGHHHQTINFPEKLSSINKWFFKDNKQDEQKKEFMEKNNLKYIFFTSREKLLGDYNLETANYLERVYDNGEVKIYKLKEL